MLARRCLGDSCAAAVSERALACGIYHDDGCGAACCVGTLTEPLQVDALRLTWGVIGAAACTCGMCVVTVC